MDTVTVYTKDVEVQFHQRDQPGERLADLSYTRIRVESRSREVAEQIVAVLELLHDGLRIIDLEHVVEGFRRAARADEGTRVEIV